MKDGAWELSPAYDMNPEPVSAANDVFELSLFGERELDIRAFCKKQSLDLFAISKKKCEEDCDKLNEILPQAISLANKSKLDKKSIQIMESRFL